MTDTPNRPPLSPAAQAVNRDLAQIMQELSKYCRVSISATDAVPITLETTDASLQAGINALCAAALRAAAERISSEADSPDGEWSSGFYEGVQETCLHLIAIAAELEGADQSTSSTH